MAKARNGWTTAQIRLLSRDRSLVPAARELLGQARFGPVEPSADGFGWWAVCRVGRQSFQVSVRPPGDDFQARCTCDRLSPQPCVHTAALLLHLAEHPELRAEAEAPKPAANDFEALLRAVFREPEDDTPRLVFADFLEENGQADRAALIRYQCEQARLPRHRKRYKELAKLTAPLLKKLRPLIEPLPNGVEHTTRRGFLRLECYASDVFRAGSAPTRFTSLFCDGWVESLKLKHISRTEPQGGESLLALVGELDLTRDPARDHELVSLVAHTAGARATGRLALIRVHPDCQKAFEQLLKVERGDRPKGNPTRNRHRDGYHRDLTPQVFDLLLHSGRLGGTRNLSLAGKLGDAQIPVLLTTNLGQLRELTLRDWSLTRTGLETLVNSPALAELTWLNLELPDSNTGDVLRVLAATDGLRELEHLLLSGHGEGDASDADVEALVKSRHFPNLSSLTLPGNAGITARGAAAILGAAHFPRLDELSLQVTGIAPRDQLPLALDAADRPDLHVMFTNFEVRRRIEGNEMIVEVRGEGRAADKRFDGMAGCAGARRVTQFSATYLKLRAGEVAPLLAGFDPKKLWRLDLHNNPLFDAGVAAIVDALGDSAVRELKIGSCGIGADGIATLLASPLWDRLHALDLSNSDVGREGVDALVNASEPGQLKQLNLTYCRLGADDPKSGKSKGPRTARGKLRAKFGAAVKF